MVEFEEKHEKYYNELYPQESSIITLLNDADRASTVENTKHVKFCLTLVSFNHFLQYPNIKNWDLRCIVKCEYSMDLLGYLQKYIINNVHQGNVNEIKFCVLPLEYRNFAVINSNYFAEDSIKKIKNIGEIFRNPEYFNNNGN